jgi:hypothetical protein
MKQLGISLIVLIGLGFAAYFFVFAPDGGGSSLPIDAFAVADTAQVQKIFLADRGGNEITLERKGRFWKVNGKSTARPDAIETLLRTATQLQVKTAVPKAKYNTVIREISGENTRAEFYDADGNLLQSYLMGPPTTGGRGNYVMQIDGKYPYSVHIPGLDGFLHIRYIVDEEEWKDRSVFRVAPADIESISVQYGGINQDSSWTVQKKDSGWVLKTLYEEEKQANPKPTLIYQEYFKYLGAEAFLNDLAAKDSVLATDPMCQIVVSYDGGKQQSCDLYFRPVNKRTKTQFDYFGNELEFSRDKYYGYINDNQDFVLIQDFVFGKLFVGPSYFTQRDPS